jgi:hypothetical protein
VDSTELAKAGRIGAPPNTNARRMAMLHRIKARVYRKTLRGETDFSVEMRPATYSVFHGPNWLTSL